MNTTRIVDLRQNAGWTQERLASESGVGLRTIQRLEAGSDASLETLSLVAEALRVPVRELFTSVENPEFDSRLTAHDDRIVEQQRARNRASTAWWWIYLGVGLAIALFGFTLGALGLVLFLTYWTGGLLIFVALRRIVLEPALESRYPLSNSGRRTTQKNNNTAEPLRDSELAS
jgi:transcriptional regulator with XRE-family HTH domain